MDGRSIVPLVTGKAETLERPWRTHFMTEFAEGGFQQWGTNGMWDYDPHGKRPALSETDLNTRSR